jgi:F420-0:gamma-glutamyl ligase
MGQGNDMKPVVIIKGFDRSNYSVNNAYDLMVNKDDDLYRF